MLSDGQRLGRYILSDEYVKDPSLVGTHLQKFLFVIAKLDLYDVENHKFSAYTSAYNIPMPQDWHLIARDMIAYLRVVKKSRKPARKKRSTKK